MSQSEITTANCPSLVSVKRRHRRWRGQRGNLIILSLLKIPLLALGTLLSTNAPSQVSKKNSQLEQLSIVEVIVEFTFAAAHYPCWPFLRLGLNDQASNVLGRGREARKRWIL